MPPVDVEPLTHEQLDEAVALLEHSTPFDLAAQVAEEKLFGGAPTGAANTLGVRRDGALAGIAVSSGEWLRLFVIGPEHLGKGIGSALLDASEAHARKRGISLLRTMDQPGNYLAPGIDARNKGTIKWFERRGYVPVAENQSLIVDIANNPRVTAGRAEQLAAACADSGFTVRRAKRADRAALTKWIAGAFSEAWAFEVELALSSKLEGVHVAQDADGQFAAFAAHDGNNRGLGWFGPAGTDPAHRGRGLGAALLMACLVDVGEAGHDECLISWIGPRTFYERTVGIAGERTYVVMAKSL